MRTFIALAACALACAAAPPPVAIPLPGGEAGIGFDDLAYAPSLHKVLVPSGRTGRLNLLDPATRALESIGGFSSTEEPAKGHGQGTTSADAGHGLVFASDRGRTVVAIVDPKRNAIVATAPLAGGPDYVRWVGPLSEVWVTEPRLEQIECFRLDGTALVRAGTIAIEDGPESLVVDATRGRAYTHTWHDATIAIDLKAHRPIATWKNGCAGARGIALDERRGLLFVGCAEGKATALDVAHDGQLVGQVGTGKGVDIIAYGAARGHLYVPAGESATLSIVAVGAGGALSLLSTVPTAEDASCVAADDLGNAWVCDPRHGRLLVIADR